MTIEIKVPAMGESVTEATVARWFKKEGESVARDEPLLELETDKVTVEVPAPAAGSIESISVQAGATVQVGAVLGAIAEGKAGAAAKPAAKTEAPKAEAPQAADAAKATKPAAVAPPAAAAPTRPGHALRQAHRGRNRNFHGLRRRHRQGWPRHQRRHAGGVGSPFLRAGDRDRSSACWPTPQ